MNYYFSHMLCPVLRWHMLLNILTLLFVHEVAKTQKSIKVEHGSNVNKSLPISSDKFKTQFSDSRRTILFKKNFPHIRERFKNECSKMGKTETWIPAVFKKWRSMHCPKLEKQTPLLNLPQIKGHTFLTCPQAKGQVTNRFCSQVTQNNHCLRLGVRLERRTVHTLVYAIWLSSSSPSSSSQFVGPHCIASSKGFVHPATQTYKTQVNNILIFF